MIHKHRIAALAGALLLAASGIALAAGNWSNLPVIGGSAYCSSYIGSPTGQTGVTGTGGGTGAGAVCGQTVPAGPPSITGEELIPLDLGGPNTGSQPQTAVIPNAIIGSLNSKRNKIIGGDFSTNLWQRGTTPVSAASPTTAVMSADRFYAYSASTQMTVIKETGASDTIPASGLYASMRVQRPSAQTGTGAVCVGQVLDKVAAQDFIGQQAILTFRALAGANLSSANSALTVTVAYYTAGDSTTPQTNTNSFAAGTITGYQAATAGLSGVTAGSVAAGVATIPITTSWASYGVYAPIPTANSSGTAVTGVGIIICDTPVGTAGTNDWFELEAVQAVVAPSIATAALPNGITGGIGFERRPAAEEALYQLAYSYVLTDGAVTQRYGMGQVTTTTNARVVIQFPEQMRETPALTVGTAASFGVTQISGTAGTCSTLAGVASSINVLNDALDCTTTTVVAGNATQFIGAASGGLLTFNAEP